MSMVSAGRAIMDDLIFHELWLAKNKFRDFENEGSESDDECETDGTSDEDCKNVKDLFKEEKSSKSKKRTRSISGHNSTEWFAVLLGVFFVAAIAGLASYQAYRSDFSDELSGSSKKTINKDSPIPVKDYVVPEGLYDGVFLPTTITPSKYVLYIDVDLEKQLYKGLVKIIMTCKNNVTNQIILYSITTNNHKISVQEEDTKTELKVDSVQYNSKREMMIITLARNLTDNKKYSLFVGFDKTMDYFAQGFYLSKYADAEGNNHVMASTYYEPTYARKAFPCFDEPKYKATFVIIILHDKENLTAVSNMPVKKTIDLDSTHTETHFVTTPLMSTYLVGWMVSGMGFKSTQIKPTLPLRVFAPEERLSETDFAISIAPSCVNYYEAHMKVNYSLPKLDLVSVTNFLSAADEVWGMIIFLENYLLYNPKTTSIVFEEYIASTICHEIAHQWFGDLVTMSTWNDLWLKESFASYLETLPLEVQFPYWQWNTTTYVKKYSPALSFDSSIYTHPVHSNIADPALLKASYDQITYLKGSSILNMLASFLGEETFFAGVHIFLEKHKYGLANENQFWKAYSQEVTDVNVSKMMNAWVNKAGYPVILFTVVNNTKLVVRQDRFVFQYKTLTNYTDDETIWHVPIKVKYQGMVDPTNMLLTTKQETQSVNTTGVAWYKANYGATGFYRVYYPSENWFALLKVLKTSHTILPAVDRASILSDVASFANYKYMTLHASLEFTLYLSQERMFSPWQVGLEQLYFMRQLFYNEPIKACIDTYLNDLITPALDELNEKITHTHDEKKLITLLLEVAVSVKKEKIITPLYRLFLEWIVRNGHVEIPTTVRASVFEVGVMMGQTYEWKALFTRYQGMTSLADKSTVLQALATTKNVKLLERLMDEVDSSTLPSLLAYACANPEGRDAAWKVLKKRYMEYYNAGNTLISFAIENCLAVGNPEVILPQVEEFVKEEHLEDNVLMKRSIEKIKYHIELKVQYKSVAKWFREHASSCAVSTR